MSQKQDNLIVVLDVGSAHTRVLAADLNEGALRFRGYGQVESSGMRKGLIAELGPAAKAVKAANEQAERMARANIDECAVGVGGPHIRGLNTRGGFDLGRHMREITREDVRNAVERARADRKAPPEAALAALVRHYAACVAVARLEVAAGCSAWAWSVETRFCTCCPASSFWMSSPASSIPWA